MPLTPLEETLLDALQDAKQHLEYCGYGDSWERSCAIDAKMPEKLEAAIEAAYVADPSARPHEGPPPQEPVKPKHHSPSKLRRHVRERLRVEANMAGLPPPTDAQFDAEYRRLNLVKKEPA